jgi:hypothetical protein
MTDVLVVKDIGTFAGFLEARKGRRSPALRRDSANPVPDHA